MINVDGIWGQITGEIRSQHNEGSLNIFVSSIFPGKVEEGTLYLEATNEFIKDFVERKYRGLIQKVLQANIPPLSCVIVTRQKKDQKPLQLGLPTIPQPEPTKHPAREPFGHRGELTFNSKYTFDMFVVGKSNQFAQAVCQAAAKSLGTMYNPIFLYGGVGLGKTHLMQAMGQEVLKNNPKAKVAYLSSEAFTNEFIDSIREKKPNEFRAKYRKKDLLLIDDVQFFAKKEGVIEEFFHTFNELFQNKKQIVLTSDVMPKKIEGLEDRMLSRFEMGMVADIQPPDLEMRVAILKRSASRVAVKFPDDVLMYLAQGVSTNIRELEGAFMRVVAYAGVVQKTIDKDLVDQIMKDFLKESAPGKISIPWIQKRVAEYFDIPDAEMISKRRSQNLVLPRQVAMRLAQIFTDSSLNQIGEAFGGRDHTTVMHSSEKIQNMIKNDRDFADEFERIKRYVTPNTN